MNKRTCSTATRNGQPKTVGRREAQALRFYVMLLFFHFSLFTLHFSLKAQETGFPLIRNYTPKEYGGMPQVWAVLQDKNTGIMYFGITPGVFSYDGARWAEIPTPSNKLARSLCQTEDGKIYVAATDDLGYLAANPQGKTVFRSLAPLIPDSTIKLGPVWSVKAAGKEVFFNTSQNIFRYLPEENKIYVFGADTNGRFLGDFVHNGSYYVRLSKKGLMKIENGKMTEAPNTAFFKDKNAFYRGAMPYDPNTVLIAGGKEGLHLYEPASNAQPKAFPLQDQTFLPGNDFYSAYPFPKKRFVLGSAKQGALLIGAQGNSLQQYHEGTLLQDNGINAINVDKSGNLWLGMPIGFSKTGHGLDLGYWDKYAGIKGNILSFVRSHNGLYVSTVQNVYRFDEQFRPKEVKGIPVGQNWALREFFPPGEGALRSAPILLAAIQSGLYQINDRQAEPIHISNAAHILLQSKQNPQRLYTNDYPNFISLLYQSGRWIHEGKWVGIVDDIRGIAEEKDGTVWLGTSAKGIIKIMPDTANIKKPKGIKYYTESDGLPSLTSNRPYWFKGELIWGTTKGLYAHNPKTDRFEPFCGLGKQFCDGSRSVFFLQEMQNGKIYISSLNNKKEDTGYLKPDGKGGYSWVYKPFRRLPEIAMINTLYAEEKGQLWIGGNTGLLRYDEKEDDKDYMMGFDCRVREVRAAGDSAVFYGGLLSGLGSGQFTGQGASDLTGVKASFEYKNNSLKFLFAAPFFDSEEKTLYSYKLQGFDEKWSDWSLHTEKEYTGLWEGAYVFKVKAKNIYDKESSIDSFAFKVAPPYYRAWWAYTLYALMTAAGAWALVRFNTRRLVLQKIALERIVDIRTIEITQKNQILSRQKEELEQQKEEILQQSVVLQSTLQKVEIEKEKSEKLLLNILPKETADELKEKGRATTKYYETVTVLFTDFKGFTQMSEKMHPEEVVENLNHCFTAFDRICKKHRIEKIKTIGDSYMCAAGIPTADTNNPERMVEAALEMIAFMRAWKAEKAALGIPVWDLRLGIHTGPVMAGVVGEDKFAYDIWGDTVNTASRMESSGEPSMINISETTYHLVKERFHCTYRGEITAKNKGQMGMYFVSITD